VSTSRDSLFQFKCHGLQLQDVFLECSMRPASLIDVRRCYLFSFISARWVVLEPAAQLGEQLVIAKWGSMVVSVAESGFFDSTGCRARGSHVRCWVLEVSQRFLQHETLYLAALCL